MNLVIVLLAGTALGFALGWVSRPRYSPSMSRAGQVTIVAGLTLVAALVLGIALGESGWTLLAICALLPVVMVAPYAGGFVRERTHAQTPRR